MTGLSPIQFAIGLPKADEQSQANVNDALLRGLPEVDVSAKRLHIVANGPTARDFDGTLPGDIMALNGALGMLVEKGIIPTYWAACDPQPDHVCRFLDGRLPIQTTYLVASKCNPAVFDRLKSRTVKLWHVNDCVVPGRQTVPCAVSVTLCALMLAQRLGYRKLDIWGWDCCYAADGAHHAGQGFLNATSDPVEIEIDGVDERYTSSATWACEAKDASGILPVLKWCGVDIAIHGRSLIAAILPEFAAPVERLAVAA